MAIADYVAQFGKRGTGNAGAGIAYGLQAQNMRNQNQRYEQQRAQQEQMAKLQEQRDYLRSGVEAIQSVPANQRQFVYQGMMAEAARRGYDVADEPTEWSDEMLPRLMGAAGVAAPKSQGDRIGAYNPRDYTPESFAKFRQTGDDSVLQRYAPSQTVTSGGVTYAFDPVSDSFKPLRTAEQVGQDVATIKGAEETAKVTSRGQAERALEQANPKAMEITSTALRLVDDLLDPKTIDDTKDLFGKGDSIYPDWARGQAETNKLTSLNQLKDILTAENLGIMSGVLSETDLRVIANIAGGGLARRQGDQRAIDELKRLREALGRKASGQKDRTGWQLMIDANGNRAYVGPNGEIEEL